METYKLLTNKEDIDSQQFFQLTEDPYQLLGDNRRIYTARSRGETRRNFLSQRIVGHWNNLPQKIIAVDSVNSFKSRLDKSGGKQQIWDNKPSLFSHHRV